MLTFEEFLVQFKNEVAEIYALSDMSKNARVAVLSTMKKYLGSARYDSLEMLELFETVCYSAMQKGQVNRKYIEKKVVSDMPTYLTNPDYSDFPEITFDEAQERGSILR